MSAQAMTTPYHLLDMTATVQVATSSVGADGSYSVSYSGSTTYPCTIQPRSATDGPKWGRNTGARLSEGFFPPDAALTKETRVVVGSTTYRVIGPSQNSAGKDVLQTLMLEEES